ncbi:MAG: COG4315 family predicted lipoprotein [Bdellovibrio sp.]
MHVVKTMTAFYFSLFFTMNIASAICPVPAPLTTVATNSGGQKIVADSNGKTLYVFDPDLNQTVPTCKVDCAEVWPPYLITEDESLHLSQPLGSIVRHNKKIQLTYAGRPVYTFAYDRINGNDLGNGLGGVWHTIKVNNADRN